MDYKARGLLYITLGIFLLPLFLLGFVLIYFGARILSWGSADEAPGHHPERCGTYGHDWRKDLPNQYPGVRCRNCLKRKDAAPEVAPVGYGAPAYVPAVPYAAPPVMTFAPAPYANAAPPPGRRCPWCLTFARPEESVCPSCGRMLV